MLGWGRGMMVQVVITSRSPLVKHPLRRSSCNLLLNHKSSPHCLLSPLSRLTVFVFLVWYIKRFSVFEAAEDRENCEG